MLYSLRISNKWLLSIPAIILASSIVLLLFPTLIFQNKPIIFRALSIDLAITLPVSYLFISNKIKWSKLYAVPLFVVGLVVSTALIPETYQNITTILITWLLPIIELTVVSIILYKVHHLRKAYKNQAKTEFYTDFLHAAQMMFPLKLAKILSFEIAVFYYAFSFKSKSKLASTEFSTYQQSGVKAVLGALLLAIAAETIGLHFLLAKWNTIAAYILTIISIYTAIQVYAIIKSLAHTPVLLNSQSITLRFGIFQSTQIQYANIKEITFFENDLEGEVQPLKISLMYQNVAIKLNKKVIVSGLYGLSKKSDYISVFIDNPKDFVNQIETRINLLNKA